MKNLQIQILITDGEKEAKAVLDVNQYQTLKELHGVSIVDETIGVLLDEIKE